ncbi:hypothetical protein D9M72_158440 [compost metagenome]
MAHHDRVVAIRARGHHVDRHAGDLLDALQVQPRIDRQLVVLRDAHGAFGPAFEGFVDRRAALDLVRAHRQDVGGFAVEFVAGAQLELLEAVEHVQLGDAQARQAVDLRRALEQRGVEPAATAAAAGGHALFGAHGAHVVAGGARRGPVELGGERTAAHAGAVGLGDAQHVVQHARAHARTGGGVAGHAVARGDVRVGAVVDVEQRALRAFEQQVGAGLVGVVQLARHVGHHGLEQHGVAHGLVEHGVVVDGGRAQHLGQHVVVQLEQHAQLGSEALGVLQILHAQRTAGDLVFVGRADAAAGGADLLDAALFTVGLARDVQRGVERQDQRAGLADAQARTHFDAGFLQAFDFLEELGRRQHHAVADVALDAGPHDAARDQVQRGLHAVDDQRVARVVAALETDHALGAFRQPVNQLALAFVAPLGPDDDHVSSGGYAHARSIA